MSIEMKHRKADRALAYFDEVLAADYIDPETGQPVDRERLRLALAQAVKWLKVHRDDGQSRAKQWPALAMHDIILALQGCFDCLDFSIPDYWERDETV